MYTTILTRHLAMRAAWKSGLFMRDCTFSRYAGSSHLRRTASAMRACRK